MATVKLSHPEKVLFPADGITKADLAAYYEAVAPAMVPHTKGRPMNLWRWNNGIDRDVVVQQAIPKGAPQWVATVEVPRRRGGDVVHAMADDADTLRWLAQVNCITPHVWTSRADRLDRPDRIIFDLDPPDEGVEFDLIRGGALALGEHLRSLGLEPYAMTSGSRGIHVLAPLRRTKPHDEVRQWAAEIGVAVAEEQATLTTDWRKNKREGRILIDTARNTYAQTTVAPYAVRAKPGAPVATPLRWEELEDPELRANSYTVATIPARLESLGDPWEGLGRA
jgi:bifunctional non-homologous end joining protein LigD